MLVDPEAFDGRDVARIYIAGRLREAKRVEAALSANGIDYAVDVDHFQSLLLGFIPREYEGVAFYVLSADAASARRLLDEAGLRAGLVDE